MPGIAIAATLVTIAPITTSARFVLPRCALTNGDTQFATAAMMVASMASQSVSAMVSCCMLWIS